MNKTRELAYWINERHAMRLRFEAYHTGESYVLFKHGFSDDPYMGEVRYCNVRREDDRVTRWLARYWRPKYHEIWHIVLARMINHIPSLNAILETLDSNDLNYTSAMLKHRRDGGEKVFTSAYTISTCGQKADKIDYVMRVVDLCKEGRWKPFSTLAAAHEDICMTDGLGSFLAAQVVADLKNTAGHPLEKAPDWWDWSAHGPGSLKGLSEYFWHSITPALYDSAIRTCYSEVCNSINHNILPLHMQDFQNCLCEFSKYERVKAGGHVRNRYKVQE